MKSVCRLDNPAYLQMLKEYQSYHEKGIWDGISLTDPNLFGTASEATVRKPQCRLLRQKWD